MAICSRTQIDLGLNTVCTSNSEFLINSPSLSAFTVTKDNRLASGSLLTTTSSEVDPETADLVNCLMRSSKEAAAKMAKEAVRAGLRICCRTGIDSRVSALWWKCQLRLADLRNGQFVGRFVLRFD